ncbi:MAG TPA: hypothetical protein VFN31_00440 [Candidatus Saccharimonadales bacterium]|nr:hypothetical protein [Candidatus Saccharimonadales bacterium]
MNLVLLPGNSKRNLNWLEQVDIAVKGGFDDTYRHSYAHWLTGHPELDLELEVDRLKPATHNLSPYMVFAKSA